MRALPARPWRARNGAATSAASTSSARTEKPPRRCSPPRSCAPKGLRVGAYISPHVRGWAERIQVDGVEADLEQALAAGRGMVHAEGATQFEVLTAAALAEFAAQGVDVAVVEAGLGGRHDATNVLDAGVVVLTNVALEHTEVLGDTREAIAAEKLAVVSPGATVILGEPEWESAARVEVALARVEVVSSSNLGARSRRRGGLSSARPVDPHPAEEVARPRTARAARRASARDLGRCT